MKLKISKALSDLLLSAEPEYKIPYILELLSKEDLTNRIDMNSIVVKEDPEYYISSFGNKIKDNHREFWIDYEYLPIKSFEVWVDKDSEFDLTNVDVLFKKESFDSWNDFTGYVIFLEDNKLNRDLAELIQIENTRVEKY